MAEGRARSRSAVIRYARQSASESSTELFRICRSRIAGVGHMPSPTSDRSRRLSAAMGSHREKVRNSARNASAGCARDAELWALLPLYARLFDDLRAHVGRPRNRRVDGRGAEGELRHDGQAAACRPRRARRPARRDAGEERLQRQPRRARAQAGLLLGV